jgi:nucleoid-associated protein YgaU
MSTGFKLLLFVALLFGAFWAYQWNIKDMRSLFVEGLHGPADSQTDGPYSSESSGSAWHGVSPEISPVPRVLDPIESNFVRVRWSARKPEPPVTPEETLDEDALRGNRADVGDAPGDQIARDWTLEELPEPRFSHESDGRDRATFSSVDDPEFAESFRRENIVSVDLVRRDEPRSERPAPEPPERHREVPPTVRTPAADESTVEIVHEVENGDTLWQISKRYLGKGHLNHKIALWNPDRIKESGQVRVGMKLRVRVPRKDVQAKSPSARRQETPSARHAIVVALDQPKPAKTRSKAPGDPTSGGVLKMVIHEVQKGDTLARLARRYFGGKAGPESWRRIFNANRALIKDPHRLTVGKRLTIPVLASHSGSQSRGAAKNRVENS